MCLIVLSYKAHDRYPLIVAANRDEFYERPSAPASLWDDASGVIAGRDLQRDGTWLGVKKTGGIAMLTNYRERPPFGRNAPSRGWLVRDFLIGDDDPQAYVERIRSEKDKYNGFNLIVGDQKGLFYYSNRGEMRELSPGLYGLSNRLLDTPWPKTEWAKKAIRSLLTRSDEPGPEEIFEILKDRRKPDDSELPDTGVGLEWERILSSIFIASPVYGTRSSSVIMIDRKNHVRFIERVFDREPEPWMTVKLDFRLHG
ncbi:MAG TPA: NRDE family protein [Syntrophales bacterium]|nr:NRDE family protein [Syntrophales bacterium]